MKSVFYKCLFYSDLLLKERYFVIFMPKQKMIPTPLLPDHQTT